MSYSVICPSCNEVNPANAYHCLKCNANLIGVPRQADPHTEAEIAARIKTAMEQHPQASIEEPKTESLGHALWRSIQGSLVVFLLALLFTALICFLGNWRTLSDFGTVLIYAGVLLVFIAWLILKGSEQFVRSQTDILNPMNRVMPGTLSERAKHYWGDYMEGMNTVAVIGFSIVLCFGFGWLLISLAN